MANKATEMELIITSKSDLRDLIDASVKHAINSSSDIQKKDGVRPKPWMTNREAQAFYGLSKSTLQRYRNSGKLPFSKIGGRVYVNVNRKVDHLIIEKWTTWAAGL